MVLCVRRRLPAGIAAQGRTSPPADVVPPTAPVARSSSRGATGPALASMLLERSRVGLDASGVSDAPGSFVLRESALGVADAAARRRLRPTIRGRGGARRFPRPRGGATARRRGAGQGHNAVSASSTGGRHRNRPLQPSALGRSSGHGSVLSSGGASVVTAAGAATPMLAPAPAASGAVVSSGGSVTANAQGPSSTPDDAAGASDAVLSTGGDGPTRFGPSVAEHGVVSSGGQGSSDTDAPVAATAAPARNPPAPMPTPMPAPILAPTPPAFARLAAADVPFGAASLFDLSSTPSDVPDVDPAAAMVVPPASPRHRNVLMVATGGASAVKQPLCDACLALTLQDVEGYVAGLVAFVRAWVHVCALTRRAPSPRTRCSFSFQSHQAPATAPCDLQTVHATSPARAGPLGGIAAAAFAAAIHATPAHATEAANSFPGSACRRHHPPPTCHPHAPCMGGRGGHVCRCLFRRRFLCVDCPSDGSRGLCHEATVSQPPVA